MNRKYTIEQYQERVAALRQACPGIALTTDIIVGFPGETEKDFDATMELLNTVRFHGAFSFKYSDRPQARSVSFADKVAEPVKAERLTRLQERQSAISLARNREYEGTVQTVMVEGESKSGAGQWSGRTATNIIVNFEAPPLAAGQEVRVRITEGLRNSLRGELLPD
jgi:tRNA-2-methylthio-N6-dimethylallyladenosine synthase